MHSSTFFRVFVAGPTGLAGAASNRLRGRAAEFFADVLSDDKL
jgi:hypothetical protein